MKKRRNDHAFEETTHKLDYIVVFEGNVSKFTKQVHIKVKDGYMPLGGPIEFRNSLIQAMVRQNPN